MGILSVEKQYLELGSDVLRE